MWLQGENPKGQSRAEAKFQRLMGGANKKKGKGNDQIAPEAFMRFSTLSKN